MHAPVVIQGPIATQTTHAERAHIAQLVLRISRCPVSMTRQTLRVDRLTAFAHEACREPK
jgi:hypothetical protein